MIKTFTVFGKRQTDYEPICDLKTGEVFDDGKPKQINLGTWSDKTLAENYAANIRKNVTKKVWKIWVE